MATPKETEKLTSQEVEKLPVGSIVFSWERERPADALVVVLDGMLPIHSLPERSDGYVPAGVPLSTWSSQEFSLLKKGNGKTPTHGTAQRLAIAWFRTIVR